MTGLFQPSPNDLGKDSAATSAGMRGINLELLVGSGLVSPAPFEIMQSIKSIEVTNTDSGRDGFQIALSVGRGNDEPRDYSIFNRTLLGPFTRVIIIVAIGTMKRVLIDGFITNQQFSPSGSPGKSTLTVTGEDYSIMMDLHEIPQKHPAQPDFVIANKLILIYGLVPIVIPPLSIDVPLPTHNDPVQMGTDLQYLQQMARKYNYVFYIEPTDRPRVNIAYWGPILRAGIPQKALTVNMGPATNVSSINFQNNALKPTMVFGAVQDKRIQNVIIPVIVPLPLPPYLAKVPAHVSNFPNVQNKIYRGSGEETVLQAYISAIGQVDSSRDAITGSGELDTLRYGEILRARKLVSVRGAGLTYDGLYYVKSITHRIERGSYKQSFSLVREGTGSVLPGVIR